MANVEITEENFEKAKVSVMGIFDDKTERNEILRDSIERAFFNEGAGLLNFI